MGLGLTCIGLCNFEQRAKKWVSEGFSNLCHSRLRVYRIFLFKPGVAIELWAQWLVGGGWEDVPRIPGAET